MNQLNSDVFSPRRWKGRARLPSEPFWIRRLRAKPPYLSCSAREYKTIAMVVSCLLIGISSAIHLEAAQHGQETPQYGGELNVGTVYIGRPPLSWDPADWAWKTNHDTGMVREQLFAADLDKSKRKGGLYPFVADAYLPEDSMRGELAESWHWEDPLTLVIKLRQGIVFAERPGFMKAREFDAEDVVYSYGIVNDSPKKIPTYFDHIDNVVARDRHTVVFSFSHFNAEWAYRFGYGYYSQIVPREMANIDPKDWHNVHGSGPFTLERYIQSNAQIYKRNPNYWDKEMVGNQPYSFPFIDTLKYRIIRDEAATLSALRTGQLDIVEIIRWITVDHLKKTTPELKWNRWLATEGTFLTMRVDMKPFEDIRVRRAMNLAVNQREILDIFMGGHGELMAYPQHADYGGYYQPLEEMPDSVQELFEYKPEKAKQLLAEAGYPNGFTFEAQVDSGNPGHMEIIPLIGSYLSKVGVKMKIKPLEYASFLSTMTTRTHGPGYFMQNGHTNPLTTLRKSFVTGQTWNPSMYSDPEFDKRIHEMNGERDEEKRIEIAKELTSQILDEAPYIWLPTRYHYTAWWPWVKNYGGELRAGAVRPGPIYARIWIDQEMKEEMGF
jgi:peptide/nickel transport system substrate-binding protein